jgi:cyclase
MLKKRIVACVVVKDGIVIQSIGFKRYLPVGDLGITLKFLDKWGIDEIIILDIDAQRPDFEHVKEVSNQCCVPLSVGGGIRSVEDMVKLISLGADKIVINTLALSTPQNITQGADVLGKQCIVVSMDVKKVNHEIYEVFGNHGRTPTGKDPVAWAREVEDLGAGEIFLTSIDQDGSKQGFDLDLISKVSDSVSIPVIACGGAGLPTHFLDLLKNTRVAAVAAANFFHFTEHSVTTLKAFLLQSGQDVRLDSYANYADAFFGIDGRVAKKDDVDLERMRYVYQPREII